MAWTQTHVVGCRVASIRRTPWIPLHDKEIVGIRDGPKFDSGDLVVQNGSVIEIDPEEICYDWTDRKFYKVRNPEGWIYEGVIDYGGDTNG